jgi:hypothetical protein
MTTIDRQYWAIANWFDADWPTVRPCRVIESSASSPNAVVRSGDAVKVVSLGMVFGDEWRAHDALADLLDSRAASARVAAANCWKGHTRPQRLRGVKGGA